MFKKCFYCLILVMLVSCGATHTMLTKRNLEIKNNMSDSIFLEPVSESQQTIFVQIRNTSGKDMLDLTSPVKAELMSKGYTIVKDPKKAHYILQANVLYCDKTDLKAMEKKIGKGIDSAILGGLVAGVTNEVLGSSRNTGTAALIGAGIGFVADSLVEDVSYSLLTDILITEKTSAPVKTKTTAKLKTGKNNKIEQESKTNINRQKYQTKIISSANKVNLKLERAIPELVSNMSKSIAGIF